MSQRSAGSSELPGQAADEYHLVGGEREERVKPKEKEESVASKWAKLLKKYWGIKRLQWIYHASGTYLGTLVSRECRTRLSTTYRIQK